MGHGPKAKSGVEPGITEVGEQLGDAIDHNAIRRAAEAVREHERKHHPASSAADDETEKIPDATIKAIIKQVEQEDCSYGYAVECHDVRWSRFVIDLADFEGRMRKDLEERRWGRRS